MNKEITEFSASEWWSKKRLRYNIGLAIAGFSAFFIYTGINYLITFPHFPPISLSQIIFEGSIYLVVMGIANFCYFSGPLSEILFKPADVKYYRKLTFNLGFWFSVALPFAYPGLIIFWLGSDFIYGGQSYACG
jgi:hypothetical protein